jgi:L-serine deaminase
VAIGGRGDGYETRQVIAMKKALMFLALSFALSAPVGGVALALIAGMTAVTTVHPRQALAKLQHFHLVRHS